MSALTEFDIRPENLQIGQEEALEADIAYLRKRKNNFVACSCPACGGHGEQAWEKQLFTYDRCENCQTVFMNPRPSEELLHSFYNSSENYSYWNKYIFPASEVSRRERIFKPRVDRLEAIIDELGVSTGAILEIGAGFGTFCEEVKSRGKFDRVVALEMTPDLAETCRERGLEVIASPIESCGIEAEAFDVIVSFEVLEHIFNPPTLVSSANKLLKSGGALILSCPNAEGFEVQMLGPVSDTIDHEHLNYFNPKSIEMLLTSQGFQVHEVITPGQLDADIVRNKVLGGQFSLTSNPFLEHILIDHWDEYGQQLQDFLAGAGLSSHMWVVAYKL
ncbi:MAG: class I SAM-dependent methyltransferase [Gammaproteobacteria bacterium]|nr:class I SAM-dependent methyltransferase [Gammaproteobacteria bacterium]